MKCTTWHCCILNTPHTLTQIHFWRLFRLFSWGIRQPPLHIPGLLLLESLGLCLNCRPQMVSSLIPNVMAPKVVIMRSTEPTSRQAFITEPAALLSSTLPSSLTTFFIAHLIVLSHVEFTDSNLTNPGRLQNFRKKSQVPNNCFFLF